MPPRADSSCRSGPGEEERRLTGTTELLPNALRVGNLTVAEGLARELGRISLAEALELTALVGQKDPRRHPRVAARWLQRYLEDFEPTLQRSPCGPSTTELEQLGG